MLKYLIFALFNLQDKSNGDPNRHIERDNIVNIESQINAAKRWLFRKKSGSTVLPPDGYKLHKRYDLGSLNPTDWNMGPSWGEYHPKHPNTYFDRAGETIKHDPFDTSVMKIGVRYKPKTFVTDDDKQITIPFVRGRLHSRMKFRYGWFEAKVKLPKGKNLWPAFWLTGARSWPPEIDIFEAYSDESNQYKEGGWKRMKIKPNLHYGKVEENSKEAYGTRSIPVWKAEDRFVHYACLWEEDRIEIYYDGQLAFKCTDPEVLKWFNMGHNWMTLVISNNVVSGKWTADEAYMEVKDLKVYRK